MTRTRPADTPRNISQKTASNSPVQKETLCALGIEEQVEHMRQAIDLLFQPIVFHAMYIIHTDETMSTQKLLMENDIIPPLPAGQLPRHHSRQLIISPSSLILDTESLIAQPSISTGNLYMTAHGKTIVRGFFPAQVHRDSYSRIDTIPYTLLQYQSGMMITAPCEDVANLQTMTESLTRWVDVISTQPV